MGQGMSGAKRENRWHNSKCPADAQAGERSHAQSGSENAATPHGKTIGEGTCEWAKLTGARAARSATSSRAADVRGRSAARVQHQTRESLLRKTPGMFHVKHPERAGSRTHAPELPAGSEPGHAEKQRPLLRSRSAATSSPPSYAPWPTGCACASGCSWVLSPPAHRPRCTRAPPQA